MTGFSLLGIPFGITQSNLLFALAGAIKSRSSGAFVAVLPFGFISGMQGVCPACWHLPSDAEWTQLENYLADNGYNYDGTIGGVRSKIAKILAATTLWRNTSSSIGVIGNNLSAINSSSFSALPCGYRDYYGYFDFIGRYGYWWSSTEYSTDDAWRRGLAYLYSNVYRYYSNEDYGFSVRCVRD